MAGGGKLTMAYGCNRLDRMAVGCVGNGGPTRVAVVAIPTIAIDVKIIDLCCEIDDRTVSHYQRYQHY